MTDSELNESEAPEIIFGLLNLSESLLGNLKPVAHARGKARRGWHIGGGQVYLPALVLSIAGMVPLMIVAERGGRPRQAFVAGIGLMLPAVAILGFSAGPLPLYLGLWLFFVGFNYLEATLPSLVSTATRIVTFVVPLFWLASRPGFRIEHVWLASVATIALQALISLGLLRVEFRRRLDVPEDPDPAQGAEPPGGARAAQAASSTEPS